IKTIRHYEQFVSSSKRLHGSYAKNPGKWLSMEFRNIKSGVDISALANTLYEREVLFPPGTTFIVEEIQDRFQTMPQDGSQPTDTENKLEITPNGEPGRIHLILSES
ncbi:MAG: hypothetical protein AAFS10_16000, partial [Myxococcota bacterium]